MPAKKSRDPIPVVAVKHKDKWTNIVASSQQLSNTRTKHPRFAAFIDELCKSATP